MKLRGMSYFLMLIMLVMLAMIVSSIRLKYIQDAVLPLVIGGGVFILVGVMLVRDLLASHRSRGIHTGEAAKEGVRKNPRGYVKAGGWIIGFFVGIYLFGYVIAIPLFLLSYMKSHGTKWLTTIILTIFTFALVYSLFQIFLKVDLYPGIIHIF